MHTNKRAHGDSGEFWTLVQCLQALIHAYICMSNGVHVWELRQWKWVEKQVQSESWAEDHTGKELPLIAWQRAISIIMDITPEVETGSMQSTCHILTH